MQKTDRRTKRIAIAIGAVLAALLGGAVALFIVNDQRIKQVPDHFPRAEPRFASVRAPWPSRFGVNANLVLENGDGPWRRHQLRAIKTNGLGWVRFTFSGSVLEPRRGDLQFALYDQVAGEVAAAGLDLIPIIAFTPKWASTLGGSDRTPAKEPEVTDRIVTAFVRRYGPGGTFWQEHPQLPPRPVRTWEIWNEENARYFFAPREGKTFAHHAVVVARAIRAVDPRARILFGGLAGHLKSRWEVTSAPRFLADAIKAQPSLRRLLDGVAYHSYIHPIAEMTCAMRDELDRLGLAKWPLVLNEFGPPAGELKGALPEPERATQMAAHVAAVVNARTCKRPPNVVLVAPYTWWSPRQDPDNREHWYGIADDRGQLLASGRAYVKTAAAASH